MHLTLKAVNPMPSLRNILLYSVRTVLYPLDLGCTSRQNWVTLGIKHEAVFLQLAVSQQILLLISNYVGTVVALFKLACLAFLYQGGCAYSEGLRL